MRRVPNHKRSTKLGAAAATGLIALLLLGVLLLPLISLAQSATNEQPAIKERNASESSEGFTLTPGNVDTSGWSEQNKSVLVNFSLDRADQARFRELRVADITAELNGEAVPLRPDSLNRRPDNDPIKVLFMIDRSGSMVNARGRNGVDKLRAARESLRYFIGNLGENYQAGIATFDVTQDVIVRLPGDKRELYRGLESIQTANKDTRLYDAIEYALGTGIKNIVFLSDGMEDTAEAKSKKREGTLAEWKQGRETELGKLARKEGIAFHSIAVGEPGNVETLQGVDYESLKNISDRSNGGTATLIDIPALNRESGNNSAHLNQALTERLKEVLAEIKKSFRFDYGLRIALPNLQEGDGELRLNLTVPTKDRRVILPMVYSYTWKKENGPPIFSAGRVLAPTFIDILPSVDWTSLTQIYLLLLSPLVLLTLLPSVFSRIAAAREMRRMTHAIQLIGQRSSLEGKQCPNETGPAGQQYVFRAGDTVLVCPNCHTPHHLSCWEYNQHQCMNRVCEYQFVIPARVLAKYGITADPRKQFA